VIFSTGVIVDSHCQVLPNTDWGSVPRVFDPDGTLVAQPIITMTSNAVERLRIMFVLLTQILCLSSQSLYLSCLKIDSCANSKDSYQILIRILRRFEKQLHIRREGQSFQHLNPVEDFCRVLIVQPGTEGIR